MHGVDVDARHKGTAVRLSDGGKAKFVIPAKRVAREPGPMITGISRATV